MADCCALTRGILDHLSKLEIGQKCIPSQVSELREDQVDRLKDQETRDIVDWLSPLNFWSKQNDMFERRCEGTGQWLIDHPEFQEWIEGEIHVLWCPGDRTTIAAFANLSKPVLGKQSLRISLDGGD